MNMVEFGNLKVGDHFFDLSEASYEDDYIIAWGGGLHRGKQFMKTEPTLRSRRYGLIGHTNAPSIDGNEFCWITPSHRVEPITNTSQL